MTDGALDHINHRQVLRALMEDDLPLFKKLFVDAQKDFNIVANSSDQFGNTYLHLAAVHNAPLIVSFLIAAGANLDARDQKGASALHIAALNSSSGALAALLTGGADPASADLDGSTPLHLAVRSPDCLKLLLGAGAMLDLARPSDWRTALHLAVNFGKKESVLTLLEAGAALEIGNYAKETPLLEAAFLRLSVQEGIFELLLDRGANIEAVNGRDMTALHVAANRGEADKVRILLERGVNSNAVDYKGRTSLFGAVDESDIVSVRYLLDAGADIFIQDKEGINVLQFSLERKAKGRASPRAFSGDPRPAQEIAELLAETAQNFQKNQEKKQAQESHRHNMGLLDRILPPRPRHKT